jgi:cytochrome c oxidase subunit 2
VPLAGGTTAVFDETYVRESDIEPNAKIRSGYPAVMPTFRGQVTEEQIIELITYIKSLTPEPEVR